MKDLMEMLMKKKGMPEKADENVKSAKMQAIQELMQVLEGMMGEDIDSMRKVTVAAPSEEGLEEGLDKAKEIVSEMPEMEEDEEDYE